MTKPVNYYISEESYWKVGQNAARVKMGKAEFVDLLIKLFADKVNPDFKMEEQELAEKIMEGEN